MTPIFIIGILLALGGIVMVALGWQEAQREAPEAVAARLSKLRDRREQLSPKTMADRDREREFAKKEEQRARAGVRRTTALPSLSRLFSTNEILLRLERDLTQSRSQWRASEIFATSVVLCLAVFCLVAYFTNALIGLVCGFAWLCLPWLYVKFLKLRHYRRFEEQLADTLLLMANSLKAGFSFLQSIDMVGRESQPPISDEFARINQEIAVGISVDQALDNLAARIKSVDVNLMVTAVIIQREVGGSLSEILETIAAVISERITLKGEIRTLTTQGRATGAVLGFLPLSLGLTLHIVTKTMSPGTPSFVEPLIHDLRGQWMAGGAVILQIIGFAIIWKVVSIKV